MVATFLDLFWSIKQDTYFKVLGLQKVIQTGMLDHKL